MTGSAHITCESGRKVTTLITTSTHVSYHAIVMRKKRHRSTYFIRMIGSLTMSDESNRAGATTHDDLGNNLDGV